MKLCREQIAFSGNKNFTRKNEVTLNSNFFGPPEFEENELVSLRFEEKELTVFISFQAYRDGKRAHLSLALRESFKSGPALLHKLPHRDFYQIKIAKLKNVREEKLEISSSLLDPLLEELPQGRVALQNKLNGSLLLLSPEQVVPVPGEKPGIGLCAKHRLLLDLEPPAWVSQVYADRFRQFYSGHPAWAEKTLCRLYPDEQTLVADEDSFRSARAFKEEMKNARIPYLSLYLLPQAAPHKKQGLLHRLMRGLLERLIGQREITLMAARPLSIDESEDIVRLSAQSMRLLGIDETDNVILEYDSRVCRARALCFDDFNEAKENNRLRCERDLMLRAGIPAHLRGKLELPYIDTAVRVRRDLRYFFRKNLNNQAITIVGLLISMEFIGSLGHWYTQALAMIGITLLLVYVSFSEIREKISNK